MSVHKWVCPSCGVEHHRDHNAAINLRNDAINKIESTAGTVETYACGGQGNKDRFSSDVDCSLKQEVQFVRMDISNYNEFESHRLKAVGSSQQSIESPSILGLVVAYFF